MQNPSLRRRRASARVRRNRAVAVLILIGVIAVAVVLVAPGTSHPSRQATRSDSTTTTRTTPATLPPTARLASWRLPAPVSRAVAVAQGETALVVGGIAADHSTTAQILRVDPSTGAQVHLGSLPIATHDAGGAGLGDRVLVFGGGAQQVSDAVQEVDAAGRASIVGHLPSKRADLSAVTIGRTAYVVGGYDGTNATRDVLATSDGVQFRVVGHLRDAVRYAAVAAVGTTIYAIGGEWAGTAKREVQTVDVRSGATDVVAKLPQARTQATADVLDGSIYVFGGQVDGHSSADILRFDPLQHTFTPAGALPAPVADSASTVVGRQALLFGGEAQVATDAVIVMESPSASTAATAAQASAIRPFAGRLLIADRGNNRLILVDAAKHVLWTYPSATAPAPAGGFYFPDDAFFVQHAHEIISNEEENNTIVRIAFPSGVVTWSYGHPRTPGSSTGYLNQPDDAYLLRNGQVTVADAKNCRILFIGANGVPASQIGTLGRCVHDPPRGVGYPNGDTPLPNGDFLVSEIHGSWITEYTPAGTLVWTVQLPIAYPSDPQQLGPDLYLAADYSRPGGIVEFTREGKIVWSYRPTSGDGMLDHPSLADRLPNGLIGVNDDYRHRVVLLDPATSRIVWQYGQTDRGGTGANQVNTPDGFDLLLPDGTAPLHPATS